MCCLGLWHGVSRSHILFKKAVNEKIRKKNRKDILDNIESKNYKKLDLEELQTEEFERKPYLTELNMQAARTKFALRTRMTKTVKLNYKNDPVNKKSLWKCNDCSSIDSQEHILWCPAYGHLRMDKNLQDDKIWPGTSNKCFNSETNKVMEDDRTRHVTFFPLLTVPWPILSFLFMFVMLSVWNIYIYHPANLT